MVDEIIENDKKQFCIFDSDYNKHISIVNKLHIHKFFPRYSDSVSIGPQECILIFFHHGILIYSEN